MTRQPTLGDEPSPGGTEVTHRLTVWRKHRGLSMAELARLSGLTTSMISQLEIGRTNLSHATLKKLARILDCEDWELLGFGPDEFVWRPDRELWEVLTDEQRKAYETLMRGFAETGERFHHDLVISSGSNLTVVDLKPAKRR